MIKKGTLPELLAPAGSPEALRAAIEGGADAVYFGGASFNARMRAANFTADTMRESIALAHAFGVRCYVTLNTLCRDIEVSDFLRAAELAWRAGADALIVADLGGAALLSRYFPEFELHASTQMSGHNLAAAAELKKFGFTRMVLARETPARDIRRFVAESGIETEVFVHGALCVSHSGQCLFSSIVGGRSGNRGECAQPCRLPDEGGHYPLSLRDLSLAAHVPTLIEMGIDSLKIEGRLKSPEYVRDVTAVWRQLLDERRAATPAEWKRLEASFSRGGFTDGYFKEELSGKMLGVRSERDKAVSREQTPFAGLTRQIPLDMTLTMKRDIPLSLTVKTKEKTATVMGDAPLVATGAPMDAAAVKKNLCRLGGTPYTLGAVTVTLDEGLMCPIGRLNDLRRRALAALGDTPRVAVELPARVPRAQELGVRPTRPTARFATAAGIFDGAADFFEHIYLPLSRFCEKADGVILPPVIFDHEKEEIKSLLTDAAARGAKHAMVGNLGGLALAREAGLVPHGDFRLNIMNGHTLEAVLSLGFADALLSPELSLAGIRDIKGAADAIIYGRIPLMLLEKCVGREVGSCASCAEGKNRYVDRRGEQFPVLRTEPHRNELVNCRPTVMSDRKGELLAAGVRGGHFIFTTEDATEAKHITEAYEKGLPLSGKSRRI